MPIPGLGEIAFLWGADEPATYPNAGNNPGAPGIFPPVGGIRFIMSTLSLPKTIFERIDGVGRRESDRRQCPRTARSDVYRACPSQAKRGFAPRYNSSRISQGFA